MKGGNNTIQIDLRDSTLLSSRRTVSDLIGFSAI